MYRQEKYAEVKRKRYPAYLGMSAEVTFLGQFQLELAMCVGKLPMLTHHVMEHVGVSIVHALQNSMI
jgi:imidazoleglycerol phosphate dehydratase HisB